MDRISSALTIAGLLVFGWIALAAAPANAASMANQQVVPLFHVALSGGNFITTNYVLTASEGATTINVKCFNNALQRVGPALGVNVVLGATSEQAQHTPTTFAVTTDVLFTGLGWCWLAGSNENDFTVQFIVGLTDDLDPGGVLKSSDATLVFSGTGAAETTSGLGGIPYFSTERSAVNFVLLLNPTENELDVTLKLFNASGAQQGSSLVRTLEPRQLDVLRIPDAFGQSTNRGSVQLSGDGNGYLGWLVTLTSGGGVLLNPIGLDEDTVNFLDEADAP